MVAEFKAPVELTGAELDAVAGGLITVVDVIDVNNNRVALPVTANVGANVNAPINVLGNQDATTVQGVRNQAAVDNIAR